MEDLFTKEELMEEIEKTERAIKESEYVGETLELMDYLDELKEI